jgi:heme exporter protein C
VRAPVFLTLLIVAAVLFAAAPVLIGNTPNEARMGLVQKIFYFHVPVAMWTLLSGLVCGGASALYLWKRRAAADRVAVAAAELAVVFGIIVFVTGPLWAIKSWGVWWEWDARLTSTVVMWMVFVSYLLLRRFGGPGSEVLAAAVGVCGMALVPFVYLSVQWWRTLHPSTSVVPSLPREMGGPFWWCFFAFTVLYLLLMETRVRIDAASRRIDDIELALED